jgi:peptidoglycan/LPS O-acetylase OafA/YrhL
MSDPAVKPSTYIPTLDGWRALSITLVILHHSQIHSSVPNTQARAYTPTLGESARP